MALAVEEKWEATQTSAASSFLVDVSFSFRGLVFKSKDSAKSFYGTFEERGLGIFFGFGSF